MAKSDDITNYLNKVNLRKKRLHTGILVATFTFIALLIIFLVLLTTSDIYELNTLWERYLPLLMGAVVITASTVFALSWAMHKANSNALQYLAENYTAPPPLKIDPVAGIVNDRKFLKALLDTMPVSCYVWDKEHNIVGANSACATLFCLQQGSEFEVNFAKCMPKYQQDGKPSIQFITERIEIAFKVGNTEFNFMHVVPTTGESIPANISMIRISTNGEEFVLCYVNDLRTHQKILNDMEHKEQLLQAVNMAAGVLLQADFGNFNVSLYRSLSMLAQAADVERVLIWEHTPEENDSFYFNQIYELSWGDAAFGRTDKRVNFKGNEASEFESNLLMGLFVRGNTENLTNQTKRHLFLTGSKSFLMLPIFLRGKIWGVIGFCDMKRIYSRGESDEAILLSGGLLIANALIRNDISLNLQQTAEELEIALFEATKASAAKSQFLSTMSHEMRTPMNAIIGMTALGLKFDAIEQKDSSFKKIEEASSHLLGVINDVLDMSKIEAGMFTVSNGPFELADVLSRVETVNSFRLEDKKQTLRMIVDPRVPSTIVADDQRITQVLTNLVSNSAKFSPEGSEIRVEAHLKDENEYVCTIQFNVVDQGIGLSAEQQTMLFKPFVQAEASTTRKYGGTGLGLAISKRIVELLDGEISVRSKLDEGATFSFTVMVGKADSSDKNKHSIGGDDVVKFPGKCMLLVEDMEINRYIVISVLEDSGIEIVCAENGAEAVKIFADNPEKYDIIFMDIHMPEMDGYDATRTIRALEYEAAKEVPIVAMTANVFSEDIEECLNAGMNAHLGKPLDFEAVFKALRTYLV